MNLFDKFTFHFRTNKLQYPINDSSITIQTPSITLLPSPPLPLSLPPLTLNDFKEGTKK